MSKPAAPTKHCCCCRDHGHGHAPLPMSHPDDEELDVRAPVPPPKNQPADADPRSPVPRNTKQTFSGSYNVRRRKPKKSSTILMPNPPLYLGYLLPYYRLPFEPAKNPDPVKHPYSYFLSLDDDMRKTWVQYRAQQTREEMGLDDKTEKYTAGPWKCGWFSATECGLHAEDWIMDKEKLMALRKLSSLNHMPSLKDSKPWEKLSMTETEFFGKGGFEAWGKSIADAALEQMQAQPGSTAILRDVGTLMESAGVLSPQAGKGKKK